MLSKLSSFSNFHAWLVIYVLLAVELPKFICLCALDVYVTLPLIPSEISGRDTPIKSSRWWLILHWLSAVVTLVLGVRKQLFLTSPAITRFTTVSEFNRHLNNYVVLLKEQIVVAAAFFVLILLNVTTLGAFDPLPALAINLITSGLMIIFLGIEHAIFRNSCPFPSFTLNSVDVAERCVRRLAIYSILSSTIVMAPVWGSFVMVLRAEWFVYHLSPIFLDRLTFLTSHPLFFLQLVWLFFVTLPFAWMFFQSMLLFSKTTPSKQQ